MYQNITSHQEPLMVLGLMPVVQIGEVIRFLRKSRMWPGADSGNEGKIETGGKNCDEEFPRPTLRGWRKSSRKLEQMLVPMPLACFSEVDSTDSNQIWVLES